jgi:YfiH family protein
VAEGEGFLRHPLLAEGGVRHGFGTRDASPPNRVLRSRQVHGARVIRLRVAPAGDLGDGDAIVSSVPGQPVGVISADCVPILATSAAGTVAAIHAGWRGLAAGVIEAAIATLRSSEPRASLRAVVGPHIGPCCYEVDAPVIDGLRRRYQGALDAQLRAGRPGHAWLDLGGLARAALASAGIPESASAALGGCTRCDAQRFHSFRRDGERAGRLLHWIAAAARP